MSITKYIFVIKRSADDWDLANPIATCSLHVLRRDSSLFVNLLTDKPKPNGPPGATEKHPFAQSKITLDLSSTKLTMGHWIEAVTDSSRYFVIRISDEKRNKEAHVGVGFRERNDALNFRMSLQEYENAMRKEAMIHGNGDNHNNNNDEENDIGLDANGTVSSVSDSQDSTVEAVSKLSLKDGEKIHINFKGASSNKSRSKKSENLSSSPYADKPPLLLRKPPPPTSSSSPLPTVVINTDAIKMTDSQDVGVTQQHSFQCASSVAAVAEKMEIDEEEWGDFECSSFDTK